MILFMSAPPVQGGERQSTQPAISASRPAGNETDHPDAGQFAKNIKRAEKQDYTRSGTAAMSLALFSAAISQVARSKVVRGAALPSQGMGAKAQDTRCTSAAGRVHLVSML